MIISLSISNLYHYANISINFHDDRTHLLSYITHSPLYMSPTWWHTTNFSLMLSLRTHIAHHHINLLHRLANDPYTYTDHVKSLTPRHHSDKYYASSTFMLHHLLVSISNTLWHISRKKSTTSVTPTQYLTSTSIDICSHKTVRHTNVLHNWCDSTTHILRTISRLCIIPCSNI